MAKIFSQSSQRSKTKKHANFVPSDFDVKLLEKWSTSESKSADNRVRKLENFEQPPYYYVPMQKRTNSKQVISNGKPKAIYLMKDRILHNIIE